MGFENPSNEVMKSILESAKTIAVVGLSDNPDRTSYQISKRMQEAGYTILPVNPTVDEVLGVKAVNSLKEIEGDIDIINVFRRPEYLPSIAKESVQTNAKVFWAQQGIVNEEASEFLKAHNFTVIMDRCIKVVHSVLIGK